jgi:hypothetical protein
MLTRVQKVEQHAVHHEYGHDPRAAPQLPKQGTAQNDGAHMRQRLARAVKIGRPAQIPQPRRAENIASREYFLHAAPPSASLVDSIAVF